MAQVVGVPHPIDLGDAQAEAMQAAVDGIAILLPGASKRVHFLAEPLALCAAEPAIGQYVGPPLIRHCRDLRRECAEEEVRLAQGGYRTPRWATCEGDAAMAQAVIDACAIVAPYREGDLEALQLIYAAVTRVRYHLHMAARRYDEARRLAYEDRLGAALEALQRASDAAQPRVMEVADGGDTGAGSSAPGA